MCEPISMGVAAAAAIAGSAYSYSEGQSAANDAASAQQQAMTAQNTAFNSRMDAQRQQLADQTAINNKANATFTQNQADTQAAQMAALGQRSDQINAMNTQQQATAAQANQTVQQGVQGASAPAMADAQATQVAQQQALNAPIVQNIQASNPLGAANTGETATAMNAGLKGAAKYVQDYGDKQATLAGYNAPVNLANTQAQGIGTNLIPAGVMDQLVRTGAPALLAPSTNAYQAAGVYGGALNTANQMLTQGAQGIATTKAANATNLANLNQTDQNAIIQGNLNVQQQQAAANAALGQGIAAIGSTALMYGASQGALKGVTTPKTTTATPGGGYTL